MRGVSNSGSKTPVSIDPNDSNIDFCLLESDSASATSENVLCISENRTTYDDL